jgi:hypothetical protein
MRPGTDLFGRSQTDANGVELTDQTDSIVRAAAEQGVPPLLLPKLENRNSKLVLWTSQTMYHMPFLNVIRPSRLS